MFSDVAIAAFVPDRKAGLILVFISATTGGRFEVLSPLHLSLIIDTYILDDIVFFEVRSGLNFDQGHE